MAEQVVNIRERIEKMRTQIYETPDSEPKEQKNESIKNEAIQTSDSEERVKEVQNNVIESTEKFKEEIKENSIKDNFQKLEKKTEDFIKKTEKIKTDNSLNVEKNLNLKRDEQLKEKIQQKTTKGEKIYDKTKFDDKKDKKSYANYHVKNVLDENQKSYVENKEQAFPQFSLNVNNPISWKLMLLIMLMQLLTNIMLVVVLYLK